MTTATAANNAETATHTTGAATPVTLGMEWSEDDAAQELLTRFLKTTDAEKPSDEEEGNDEPAGSKPEPKEKVPAEKPATDDEAKGEEDKDEEADEKEEKEGDDKAKKSFADENSAYVKIKVGDDEHEVPVSKLTRLYGQEAALTKKSMEVAELRKATDAETSKNVAATQALLSLATKRFEPYSKLDFNLLATQLDPAEYTALRDSARQAWEEKQFLEQHLDGYVQAIQEKQSGELREKAKETLKVLSGPVDKGGIEGFSQKLYDEVRTFGVQYGIPQEAVNSATDPWAIRLMHDAMLYARSRDKAAVKTVKVNKGPKKIVKTTNSPASERDGVTNSAAATKAMNRLQQTGDVDDAAAALMARWKSDD